MSRASPKARSVGGVRSIPLAPFASRQTASFVEHSPSTVIELKLRSTAGKGGRAPRRARAGVGRATAASSPASVRSSPAFAIPPTVKPSIVTLFLAPRVRRQDRVSGGRTAVRRELAGGLLQPRDPSSSGSSGPITPVERIRVPLPSRSSSRPASAAVARASNSPRSPVAVSATPQLTTIAWGSETSAMLTVNQVLAAPVVVSKEHLEVAQPGDRRQLGRRERRHRRSRRVGCARHGRRGRRLLDLYAEEVLILSTGVIGTLLPLE